MKIESKRFGTIEVKEDRILTLEGGLLGFSNLEKFVLVDDEVDPTLPFKWLISVEDPNIGFLVTDPGMFFSDYVFDLSAEDAAKLGVSTADDLTVMCLLTVPADPRMITANLRGPLVFNNNTKHGRQIVLQDSTYATKHYIFVQKSDEAQKSVDADVESNAALAFSAQAPADLDVKAQS